MTYSIIIRNVRPEDNLSGFNLCCIDENGDIYPIRIEDETDFKEWISMDFETEMEMLRELQYGAKIRDITVSFIKEPIRYAILNLKKSWEL